MVGPLRKCPEFILFLKLSQSPFLSGSWSIHCSFEKMHIRQLKYQPFLWALLYNSSVLTQEAHSLGVAPLFRPMTHCCQNGPKFFLGLSSIVNANATIGKFFQEILHLMINYCVIKAIVLQQTLLLRYLQIIQKSTNGNNMSFIPQNND